MLEYHIRAIVRSKKNSRRLFSNGGHVVSLASKAYEVFREEALFELLGQRPKDLKPPYVVYYTFYIKGKKGLDLDNAVASINDILQEAGIIVDDGYIEELHAKKKLNQKDTLTVIRFVGY